MASPCDLPVGPATKRPAAGHPSHRRADHPFGSTGSGRGPDRVTGELLGRAAGAGHGRDDVAAEALVVVGDVLAVRVLLAPDLVEVGGFLHLLLRDPED